MFCVCLTSHRSNHVRMSPCARDPWNAEDTDIENVLLSRDDTTEVLVRQIACVYKSKIKMSCLTTGIDLKSFKKKKIYNNDKQIQIVH